MANLVMRGRTQAIMLATMFSVLSLILPPLSYFSGAIVALVTLRKSTQEGFLIFLSAGVAVAIISYFSLGNSMIALVYAGAVWIPVWLLAQILRATISLSKTLVFAGGFGLLVVIGFHVVLGNPIEWWQGILDQMFMQAAQQSQELDATGLNSMSEMAAQVMTGIIAATFVLSLVGSLLLGRWWQAVLFNPGGFQGEFHALSLNKLVAGLIAATALGAIFTGSGSFVADLAAVVITLASIYGLSLIHDWINSTEVNRMWLTAIYLLLLIFTFQVMAALAFLACLNAWLDMRKNFKKMMD